MDDALPDVLPLRERPVEELREMAQTLQITGCDALDGDELLDVLLAHFSTQAQADAASSAHDFQNSAAAARLAGLHPPPEPLS